MTGPTLLNGANNSGIAANGGNSVFAGGRKELAMRLLSMPSSQSPNKVVYMSFSFLQLAVGSCDLSQAEKEITLCKGEYIHPMATNFHSK